MSMISAGIVLISEDFISVVRNDYLSEYLLKELESLEYVVNKITVIPNNESFIVNELQTLTKTCDIIIAICGKCGTFYKALGNLISQNLQKSEELISFYNGIGDVFDEDDVNLPIQAKIISQRGIHPIIQFQRVFLLNEKYLKQSFANILKNHLIEYRKPKVYKKVIKIAKNGNSLADLNGINSVTNKSAYVEFTKTDEFYIFKISSSNLADVVEFEKKIKENFEAYRLKFEDESDVWKSVFSSQEKHVQLALENIKHCLNEYGLDNIFMSFNGGKDCTVLLHLLLTVVKINYPDYNKPILCLYVQSDKPFPEQEEFISQIETYYNLKILTIKSGIREALHETLEKFANYKACFMGTRRTDPYSGNLNIFQMTDSNWPQIMRVSPLLDWHYSDIWDYLLYYKVPYCSLYDMGFTSLGNIVNTKRNPYLIYFDYYDKQEKYLPAFKLLTSIKERNGRNSS